VFNAKVPQNLKSVDVLFAEPYFKGGERRWGGENCMMFCSKIAELGPLLNKDTVFLPARASLMGALVECPSLFARKQCVSRVLEFDVSKFNRLHEGDVIFADQMWRHGHRVLSTPFRLLDLDFARPKSQEVQVTAEIKESGRLHALVLWVDYTVDDSDANSVWSTGGLAEAPVASAKPSLKAKKQKVAKSPSSMVFAPTCWYQGVRLLPGSEETTGTQVRVSAQINTRTLQMDAQVK